MLLVFEMANTLESTGRGEILSLKPLLDQGRQLATIDKVAQSNPIRVCFQVSTAGPRE